MYERFTDRARKVMQLANQEARRFNNDYVRPEHILLGLIQEESGVAANVLKNLNIDLPKIHAEVEKVIQPRPGEPESKGHPRHAPKTKKVIDSAIEEARDLNHNYVGSEHLLLGLVKEAEGLANQVLTESGLTLQKVRDEVLNLLGQNMPVEGFPKLPDPPIPTPDPRTQELDEEIDRLNMEKESAVMEQDFVRAAALRDQVLELQRRRGEILSTTPQQGASDSFASGETSNKELHQFGNSKLRSYIDSWQKNAKSPKSAKPQQELAMYAQFTDRPRKVMQLAKQEAQRFNHEYIGTEHILLGLIREDSGVAANVLKNLDLNLERVRLKVESIIQHGPARAQPVMDPLPYTPRAKKVIDYSVEEARNLEHHYVRTEHLLLGLLREQEGVAAQVLIHFGLTLTKLREEVLNLLKPAEYDKIPKSLNPGTIEAYPVSDLTLSDLTPTDVSIQPEPHIDEQTKHPEAIEIQPLSESASPTPTETLTVYQIELIHERIRQLNEQKEVYEAAQDFLQAGQFKAEAEALNKLLELYHWYQSRPLK